MAHDVEQRIMIPELDTAKTKARLVLRTGKSLRGGIFSTASVCHTEDGMMHFVIGRDYYKIIAQSPGAATQKRIDAQHAATFTQQAIEAIKAEVLAYYKR